MSSPVQTLLKLYSPALSTCLALICVRWANPKFTIPVGILGFDAPLPGVFVARFALVVCALAILTVYAVNDYSSLFPTHLEMDVFYDDPGLAQVLDKHFDPESLRRASVPSNYRDYRGRYFKLLDAEVRGIQQSGFFSVLDADVHSSGKTSFIVKKAGTWQRYHLEESEGELVHTLEAPHVPSRQFLTLFERLQSPDDYFEATVLDSVFSGGVVIRPQFKQLLAENRTSQSVTFNVLVVGMTQVKIFPWPGFSPTVYCAKFEGVGLVPVAYGIYK